MAEQVNPDDRKRERVKITTRPQDWAAPARAHLFGLHTLTEAERERELSRMSHGRPAYRAR